MSAVHIYIVNINIISKLIFKYQRLTRNEYPYVGNIIQWLMQNICFLKKI